MATIKELRQTIRDIFAEPTVPQIENFLQKTATADARTQRIFSIFRTEDQVRVREVYERFIKLADTAATPEEGIQAVINEYLQLKGQEHPDLLYFALMVFITHSKRGQKYLSIPPILLRDPHKVVPSNARLEDGKVITIEDTGEGATPPEDKLDWFREDVIFNEHHGHWHVVFPVPGVSKRLLDRQGELFIYMHHQMIARYDTERLLTGLGRVVPFSNYEQPVTNGYNPGQVLSIIYSPRPANQFVRDMPQPSPTNPALVYTVAEQVTYGDRLLEAMRTGYFSVKGKRIKVTPNTVGATVEADVGSVDRTTYGSYHNQGHNLFSFIGAKLDPEGNITSAGVIGDVVTAVRDPVFFEWHKNIDNLNIVWQDTQRPHDFEADAPAVSIRKGFDFGDQPWTPDIIICKNSDIPGFGTKDFDGQKIGEAAFGGLNWDKDFTEGRFDFYVDDKTLQIKTVRTLNTWVMTEPVEIKLTRPGSSVPDTYQVPFTHLAHDEFSYFIRVENKLPVAQNIVVRMFLVLNGYENDRTTWIEMDKFLYTLPAAIKNYPSQSIIFRQDSDSAILRKPVSQYKKLKDYVYNYDENEQEFNENWEDVWPQAYCICGWPYQLLLPRGTKEGAVFTLMVMITDAEKDYVPSDDPNCCGSMSFCSARTFIYPDARPMGYPFDRPFKYSIPETIATLPNMASRTIYIQEVDPPKAES